MSNRLFALLAGIDRYANAEQAPPLRGCVADVEGSYALLTSRFGVPPAQIRLLTARLDQSEPDEARPSRANLLRGWQEHLSQAGPGDLVFFHFSGYGSQAHSVDSAEPGEFEPTIVPYDSRTPGVFDLSAQELAALIRPIEARGAQVVLLLDCCHTPGSERRVVSGAGAPAVRRCPPDERSRPAESFFHSELAPPMTDAPLTSTPAKLGPSGWLPLGRYVLLAACRAGEAAYEYLALDSDGWRGATSYFFQQMLAASPPGVTWAQLHDALLVQLHAVYAGQTPQLEGPSNLEVFGGIGREVTPFLLVQEVEGQEYARVGGGAALGLTPGSRVALYPPASAPADGPADDLTGEPLAYGLVEEVRADHAWAKLDRLIAMPPDARARVLTIELADLVYRVSTEDLMLRQALLTGERSPFLRLNETVDRLGIPAAGELPASADFIVTSSRGVYTLLDGAGEPLVEAQPPVSPEGALDVLAMLEHLAIYRNVQRLHNPTGGSLQGDLLVEAAAFAQTDQAGYPLGPVPLHDGGHNAVIVAGHKVQLTIHNRAPEPVYLAVFALDDDYGIRRVYPVSVAYQLVHPQGSVLLEPFEPQLAPGRTQARMFLKVIATRTPMSFDVLQLPKLGQGDPRAGVRASEETPLGRLLNGLRRQGTRDLALTVEHHAEEWAVRSIELTILSQPLPPGAPQS